MNNEQNNDKLSDDLRKYLESVPPVTKADLDGLEKAARNLDNDPAFLAECSKEAFVENLIAERDALKAQVEELALQDRLKTREINTLVPENRNLIAERDELRAAVVRLLAVFYHEDHNAETKIDAAAKARLLLVKTAPKT